MDLIHEGIWIRKLCSIKWSLVLYIRNRLNTFKCCNSACYILGAPQSAQELFPLIVRMACIPAGSEGVLRLLDLLISLPWREFRICCSIALIHSSLSCVYTKEQDKFPYKTSPYGSPQFEILYSLNSLITIVGAWLCNPFWIHYPWCTCSSCTNLGVSSLKMPLFVF